MGRASTVLVLLSTFAGLNNQHNLASFCQINFGGSVSAVGLGFEAAPLVLSEAHALGRRRSRR
jgi:hypothetical protein